MPFNKEWQGTGVPKKPRPNQRCYLHLWCRFLKQDNLIRWANVWNLPTLFTSALKTAAFSYRYPLSFILYREDSYFFSIVQSIHIFMYLWFQNSEIYFQVSLNSPMLHSGPLPKAGKQPFAKTNQTENKCKYKSNGTNENADKCNYKSNSTQM